MSTFASHIPARYDSDRLVMAEGERKARHLDYVERGYVLSDIVQQFEARRMSWAEAHEACGLADGVLRDGSQSTETLHAALRHLRGLPR